MSNPIFLAIDKPRRRDALALLASVKHLIGGVKLGLEFFTAEGPDGIAAIMASAPDLPLFLDLKLHDIPNTVAAAVASVAHLKPSFITVHALGGEAMIEAAVEATTQSSHSSPPKILAVTVLTSLNEADLAATGQNGPVEDQVERLACMAIASKASGLICSPHEIARLRRAIGRKPVLMVPGIRPQGAALGDQKRTMTPQDAITAGADFLVIGRPISAADNPVQATENILKELQQQESGL